MWNTSITRRFGMTTPIVNAGMAMVAGPGLAAAVSNAGGLGTIGCDIAPPEALRRMVRECRASTDRPFGVDLIGDFVTDDHIGIVVDEKVALAIFFWSPPTAAQCARLRRAGTTVWMQIGGVAEAEAAVALGVDGLIVQGAEAGGHNRSEASTMTLFPRIRRFYPEMPMLAAGGIVDGATMAAALVLGADAVWCGSRFLAAVESAAHDDYKDRVVAADVGDTVITTLYGPEWPDQPVRAIVNDGLRAALDRAADDPTEQEGGPAGTTVLRGAAMDMPHFSAILPTTEFRGDIELTCLTAGQSAGNIDRILPAGEIVSSMTREAEAALARLGLRSSAAQVCRTRNEGRSDQ